MITVTLTNDEAQFLISLINDEKKFAIACIHSAEHTLEHIHCGNISENVQKNTIKESEESINFCNNLLKQFDVEKKWRAFRTFDELKENGLILGLHLTYRRKDNREQRNIGISTGFQLVDNKLTISIGPNTFSLNQLFNEYEHYDALEWKPFGIEEAEETEE